jgi:hypothetical protein
VSSQEEVIIVFLESTNIFLSFIPQPFQGDPMLLVLAEKVDFYPDHGLHSEDGSSMFL